MLDFTEPWLAVVIDPIRTMASGQVDLGAFRTYRKGFLPAEEKHNELRNIPLKKVEDFGSHYKEYYQLNVSYFKTSTDKRLLNQLWKQYWVASLSSSPWLKNLGYNIEQTQDVAAKMTEALSEARRENFGYGYGGKSNDGEASSNLKKAVRDGKKLSCEACMTVMQQIIKCGVFNDYQATGRRGEDVVLEELPAEEVNGEEAPLAEEEKMNVD